MARLMAVSWRIAMRAYSARSARAIMRTPLNDESRPNGRLS